MLARTSRRLLLNLRNTSSSSPVVYHRFSTCYQRYNPVDDKTPDAVSHNLSGKLRANSEKDVTRQQQRPADLDVVDSVPVDVSDAALGATTPVDSITGAPVALATSRTVHIYKRARNSMQQGTRGTHEWIIDWDISQKLNRWENDMIGWQSSADYMQATLVEFTSKDDAVKFAEKNGWDYYLQEPHERKFKKKEYAENYYHHSGPLKLIRTK